MSNPHQQPLINPYGNIDDIQTNQPESPYQPVHQIQPFVPPPPPQPPVISAQVIHLPPGVKPNHKKYNIIVEKSRQPCKVCTWNKTTNVKYQNGCKVYSYSVGLFMVTGFICFWIPCVIKKCKDMKIECGRCGNVKAIIQNKCCQ